MVPLLLPSYILYINTSNINKLYTPKNINALLSQGWIWTDNYLVTKTILKNNQNNQNKGLI